MTDSNIILYSFSVLIGLIPPVIVFLSIYIVDVEEQRVINEQRTLTHHEKDTPRPFRS